jgi:putative ATP-dependent endonuclease of OLD family
MVEGMAEALLIPVLAQIAGGNLKDSAVTVLNTDGLNFNAFLPLFGEGKLGMPVVILTDGDDADRSGTPSATATGLKAKEGEIPNLRVELGELTFEHELARSSEILPYMLQAYEAIHPQNGAALKVLINRLTDREAKADAFLAEFKRNRTGKGAYAQELASLIENAELTAESVPEYIRDALMHLNVINSKEPDEPEAAPSGSDPLSGTN